MKFWASIMIDSDISIVAVSKILGRAKVSTTYDIYAHLLSDGGEVALKTQEHIKQQEAKIEEKMSHGRTVLSASLKSHICAPKNGAEEEIRTPDPLLDNQNLPFL